MTCPEPHALAEFVDGDLGESRAREMRAHIGQCTRCSTMVRELDELRRDLTAPLVGALGTHTEETFADAVLAKIDHPPKRAPLLPRLLAYAAAAVVILGVGFTLSRRTSDEWTARGTTPSATNDLRQTALRFGRVAAGRFEPIADGAAIDARDPIAAEVGNTTEGRFLLAFLVDSKNERHWIYPAWEAAAPPPSAHPLPQVGAPRVLTSMTRLDRPAPGPARLVGIVLARPDGVGYVENARVEELQRARLATHYEGALVVETQVVLVEVP